MPQPTTVAATPSLGHHPQLDARAAKCRALDTCECLKSSPLPSSIFLSTTPRASSHSHPHLPNVRTVIAGCQFGDCHHHQLSALCFIPVHGDNIAHRLPPLLCGPRSLTMARRSSQADSLTPRPSASATSSSPCSHGRPFLISDVISPFPSPLRCHSRPL
jgi:hypothetical protein